MEVTELRFRADLNRGIAMTPLRNAFLTGDQEAHRFIVECVKGLDPVALGGANVRGYFVRSDQKTIIVEGNAADNRAQVLLPPECYTRPGRFSLLVKVSFGGIVQTVLWAEGSMSRGKTDMIIDPGEVLPNLEELLALVDRLEGQVTNIYIGSDTPPDGYNVWIDPAGQAAEDDLPLGKAPYQMIVTGPDGVTRWEERTHYDYSGGTVLPLTDLKVVGGYATFREPFDTLPQAGAPYKVTYLGFEYECTGIATEVDGKPCVVIGNESHMGQGLNTREPFIFVFYNPEDVTDGIYGWFSCLATNKPTIPVSIVGNGELKKIDKKFLPDDIGGGGLPTGGEPYKQLVTDGEGNTVWADRLAYEDESGNVHKIDAKYLPEMNATPSAGGGVPLFSININSGASATGFDFIGSLDTLEGDRLSFDKIMETIIMNGFFACDWWEEESESGSIVCPLEFTPVEEARIAYMTIYANGAFKKGLIFFSDTETGWD